MFLSLITVLKPW